MAQAVIGAIASIHLHGSMGPWGPRGKSPITNTHVPCRHTLQWCRIQPPRITYAFAAGSISECSNACHILNVTEMYFALCEFCLLCSMLQWIRISNPSLCNIFSRIEVYLHKALFLSMLAPYNISKHSLIGMPFCGEQKVTVGVWFRNHKLFN